MDIFVRKCLINYEDHVTGYIDAERTESSVRSASIELTLLILFIKGCVTVSN